VTASVSSAQRHVRGRRCPICEGADGDPRGKGKRCNGFVSSDEKYVHCSRSEFAGGIQMTENSETYAHRVKGLCKCGQTHGADTYTASNTIEAVYDYRDERGALLFQVVRKSGKKFLQRVPDGAGDWIWKLNGVRRVPYRLPELLAADLKAVVYIVEGEKDVDALVKRGFVATCNPGGEGKWSYVADVASAALAGRDVVIIADNDDVGRAHARDVAARVGSVTRSVRVVAAPVPHKDVSDLLSAGGAVNELVPLDAAPPTDAPSNDTVDEPAGYLPTLDSMLEGAMVRAEKRASGEEKPVPLPFRSLAEHFGGGLWPGVHVLTANTGIGKTQIGLQFAKHAAENRIPTVYIGLELEAMQVSLRLLGEQARVPWSKLYTGQAGPAYIAKARAAIPSFTGLPLHFEFGRPQGWPVSELECVGEAMRRRYPDRSTPLLIVLDYLQLIAGDSKTELRERIGGAAYAARDIAVRLDAAVWIVSSIARDKMRVLADAVTAAGLTYELDDQGRPAARHVLAPDVLVGLGKESGDIEFASDSVSVLFRVPGSAIKDGDVIFATAKGRATGARWSPMKFTGFRYEEPADGGARTVELFASAKEKRQRARSDADKAKEKVKSDEASKDVVAVTQFVLDNPGCSVRAAREMAVDNNSRRWAAAKERLGAALVASGGAKTGAAIGLTIDLSKLAKDVRAAVADDAAPPSDCASTPWEA